MTELEIPISGLPSATLPLSGSEKVPMVQGGVTVEASTQDIADLGDGGSSTFEDLTDSPYDNTQLATALNSKQDRLAGIVSGCVITVESFVGVDTNKRIRVTSGTWYIPTSEYTKATDTISDEITLCPIGGDFKYYDIVADNTNAITIHEGTPSTSPAHYVIDPLTQVLLGFITVGDAVIEEPTAIVGGFVPLTGTLEMRGDLTNLNSTTNEERSVRITGDGVAIFHQNINSAPHSAEVRASGVNGITSKLIHEFNSALNRAFRVTFGKFLIGGDIARYNDFRAYDSNEANTVMTHAVIAAKIDADPYALITRQYFEDNSGSGTTDLSITNRTATTLDVASSTGDAATIPQASITEAGLLNNTDKVKLNNTTNVNSGNETASTIGALLTTDATPLDTDFLVSWDGTLLLKTTFANVKAFLKTYFEAQALVFSSLITFNSIKSLTLAQATPRVVTVGTDGTFASTYKLTSVFAWRQYQVLASAITSTTKTSLIRVGLGAKTIATADINQLGFVLESSGAGTITTGVSPGTAQFILENNGTVLLDTTALSLTTIVGISQTNAPFTWEFKIQTSVTGASGKLTGYLIMRFGAVAYTYQFVAESAAHSLLVDAILDFNLTLGSGATNSITSTCSFTNTL